MAVDGTRGQALILTNTSEAGNPPALGFEDPLNLGIGPDPVDVTAYRPGASDEALSDLVVISPSEASVLVLRNISF